MTVNSDNLQRKARILLYPGGDLLVDLPEVAGKFIPARIVDVAILACQCQVPGII